MDVPRPPSHMWNQWLVGGGQGDHGQWPGCRGEILIFVIQFVSLKRFDTRCYDEKKRIHWQAWWKLCKPKNQGGMGFRDLQCFNLAMLAKQVWRLLCEPESLCARVLRAKYFPDGRLLHACMKSGSSFTWQSILAGLECFKRGYIWRVGDGS